MTVFAPIMKVRDLLRRWTTEHVPVIIPPEHYPLVVNEVREALEAGGLVTAPRRAPWMLRFPTAILTWFAGRGGRELRRSPPRPVPPRRLKSPGPACALV